MLKLGKFKRIRSSCLILGIKVVGLDHKGKGRPRLLLLIGDGVRIC